MTELLDVVQQTAAELAEAGVMDDDTQLVSCSKQIKESQVAAP